jgi:hypothetical protein
MSLPAFLLAVWLAAAPAAAPDLPPGPTLAVEDTMHAEVPEVLVRAPRVTLDEILARVALGEARRDLLLHDVAFTATLRIVRGAHGDAGPRLILETVSRVYKRKPDQVRSVTLRHWEAKHSKMAQADMEFDSGTEEQIVNFAFRPEARRDFRYRIVGRDLLGDHLVYRIAFEPRSLVRAAAPGGLVWVDTRDFVIVRQELDFSRSPAPLLIKDIDRLVIERQRVDGHWVLRRVLMRAAMTVPVPRFGRSFDVAIQFDDYRINRGIDDAVFRRGTGP